MALADELLDSISEEQFAEYMLVEENPHIVIDEDRNIILPERYKIIAAQGDHDMATYTFDCPRFSDGRDMSKMVVYINYIRSDGETGSYPADNVSIDAQDNDLMHFEWTPLLPATLEHGAFAFLVCVCRAEPDGSIKNHWSTRLCKDATISEGMDCHKDTIINMYPDVITRILERLNVLEDGGTTSVQYTVQDLEEEQKVQARKNIEAADAKEVSKLSEEKANRIVETASGETIVVTDSAEAKPLGLSLDGKSEQKQLSGKNLVDITVSSTSVNGIEITNHGDGSFDAVGTSTQDTAIILCKKETYEDYILEGGDYKLSIVNATYNAETCNITMTYSIDGTVKYFLPTSNTFPVGAIANNINLWIPSGITINLKNVKIQLEKGSVATDWEPYCGGVPSPNPSYPQEIRNIGVYDEASGKYAVEVNTTYPITDIPMEQGAISYYQGYDYLTAKTESNSRIRCVDLIDFENDEVKFEWNDNVYELVIQYFGTDKLMHSNVLEGIDEWHSVSPVTLKANGYFAFAIRRKDGSNITPSEFKNVELELWIYRKGTTTATVYLDEPLRKGDKAYWNGDKMLVERNRAVEVFDGSDDERLVIQADTLWYSQKELNTIPKDFSFLCDSYRNANVSDNVGNNAYINSSKWAVFYDSRFASVSELRTWLQSNPVEFEYQLAEPITEEIDIDLGELSMFYSTTVISNDCNANMEVEYIADTKAYVDKKITEVITAML